MFKMRSIWKLHLCIRNTTKLSTHYSSTNTAADSRDEAQSLDKIPASLPQTKIQDKKEKEFDYPKPYLDEKVLNMFGRKDKIDLKRLLANWQNDQENGKNWPETWTAPAPFDPHKFPLDIRMGAKQKLIPKPHKYDNMELMKVQNFLHLTPPAIKKHCEGLKKFCTNWPEELKSDEDCEREFPVEINTTDYVRAGQSQRNSSARKVCLKIRLCNLVLDQHARLKLMKLANRRYNPKTDVLTIESERCPVRKQNREYLDYLLTVLFYEAWKTEQWETREFIEDQDGIYWWKDSKSYKSLIRILKSSSEYKSLFNDSDESAEPQMSIEDVAEVKEYRDAVVNIKVPDQNITAEERRQAMIKYKESVTTMLNLPQLD